MRTQRVSTAAALAGIIWLACLGSVANAGTRVAWDGWLIDGMTVLDGQYDLRFQLFATETGGSKLGSDVFKQDVAVVQGYFSATLDFGVDVFDGRTRYVEVAFRLGSLNDPYPYKVLNAPRQPLVRTCENIMAQNICIGTGSSDGGLLTVNGEVHVTSGSNLVFKAAGYDPGDIIFQNVDGSQKARIWSAPTAGAVGLYLTVNPANVPQITLAGNDNVGIGTTAAPQTKLDVNGQIRWVGSNGLGIRFSDNDLDMPNPYIEVWSEHNSNAYGINAWLSSEKAKKNITDLEVDSNKIYDLRPVSFNWKEQGDGAPKAIGLIAEDVDKVLPQLVGYDKEGKPHHVTYELLSVLTLKELQKLRQGLSAAQEGNLRHPADPAAAADAAKIADMRAENAALKQKMADLEAKLNRLAEKLQ